MTDKTTGAAVVTDANQPKLHNQVASRRITDIAVHALLGILAIIWVMPIVWVVLESFNKDTAPYQQTFFPTEYTLNNYVQLFTETEVLNFPRMFMNTFIIAVFTCVISVSFVLLVSFCLSRLRFPFRRIYMNTALVLGMFPGIMAVVAIYFILKALRLTGGSTTNIALIIVYSAGAGMTFYMIPWLDFVLARAIARTQDNYTVSLGLWRMLEREYIQDWFARFAAGAVCVSIPIVILFILMQRFYQESMAGSVKG